MDEELELDAAAIMVARSSVVSVCVYAMRTGDGAALTDATCTRICGNVSRGMNDRMSRLGLDE